jgi:hypothetical protein
LSTAATTIDGPISAGGQAVFDLVLGFLKAQEERLTLIWCLVRNLGLFSCARFKTAAKGGVIQFTVLYLFVCCACLLQ